MTRLEMERAFEKWWAYEGRYLHSYLPRTVYDAMKLGFIAALASVHGVRQAEG